MVNANNHYFKLPYDGMQEGESHQLHVLHAQGLGQFVQGERPGADQMGRRRATTCADSPPQQGGQVLVPDAPPPERASTDPERPPRPPAPCPPFPFRGHLGVDVPQNRRLRLRRSFLGGPLSPEAGFPAPERRRPFLPSRPFRLLVGPFPKPHPTPGPPGPSRRPPPPGLPRFPPHRPLPGPPNRPPGPVGGHPRPNLHVSRRPSCWNTRLLDLPIRRQQPVEEIPGFVAQLHPQARDGAVQVRQPGTEVLEHPPQATGGGLGSPSRRLRTPRANCSCCSRVRGLPSWAPSHDSIPRQDAISSSKEFAKANAKFEVKAAAFEGELIPASQIDRLATLPTYEEAIARLMATMKRSCVAGKLVRTLAAVRDAKEAA